MKSKLLSLLLVFVLASCSSDDDSKTPGDGSYLELNVNGQSLSMPRSTFIANENCDYIYATVMDVPEDYDTRFRMEFELTTSGRINKVMFIEFSDNNRQYQTVNFKPSETFSINNFSYDPAARQLYFEFEGELYEADHPENTKHISGKMHYNNITSIDCGFFQRHVTVNNGAMHFTRWIVNTSDDRVLYQFYSDNGYLFHIHTNTDIANVAPGSYAFGPDSPLRINLYKYIGETKATSIQPLYTNEWELYNCTGTIHIDQQNQLPFVCTKGTFTFDATDSEGNSIFQNLSGNFEI